MLVDHTFDKYKQFKLGENVYFAKEIQILDQNLIFSLKNTQKSSSKYQSCPVVIWKSLNLFALKGLGDSDFLKEKPFSLLAVNFEPACWMHYTLKFFLVIPWFLIDFRFEYFDVFSPEKYRICTKNVVLLIHGFFSTSKSAPDLCFQNRKSALSMLLFSHHSFSNLQPSAHHLGAFSYTHGNKLNKR